MIDRIRGDVDTSVATQTEGKTYEEGMKEFWEDLQEIDDPWERAVYAQNWLHSGRKTALSYIILNAIAYDLAAETFK